MSVNFDKIKSYLNFAKKSRNIVYGSDDIVKLSKKCELILVSSELSENAKSKLDTKLKLQNKNYECLENDLFQKIIENENIKAIAITDKNLSDAIKNYLD